MKKLSAILEENKKSKRLISEEAVEEARKELLEKSDHQIERDTAIKWGARYLAAKDMKGRDEDNFKHEALEHAALSNAEFLLQIIAEIGESK